MCSLLTNTNTRLLSCMTCTDTLLTVPTDTLCPYQRTLSVRTTGHSQSVRTYEQTLLVPTNKHCPHLRTNTVRTDEQPLSAQTMRGSRIEPAFTNSAVLLERFKLFRSFSLCLSDGGLNLTELRHTTHDWIEDEVGRSDSTQTQTPGYD